MIKRYSRPEMRSIWGDYSKYSIWCDIELYACEALVMCGLIPDEVVYQLKSVDRFDVERINEIEAVVKHDVIAFLTYLSEVSGAQMRYLHYGMTSSDVLDTCLSVQLKQSLELMLKGVSRVRDALKTLAIKYKDLLGVGRTHGMHGEPLPFGLRFLRFYAEFDRAYKRLSFAGSDIAVCKISGAMGNYIRLPVEVERYVALKLGLSPECVASQVIPRDRHAMFFSVLGCLASSIENIAIEIRHLHRSEVGEVSEFFSVGQKGSSAMPHKRNPILTENLTGLARMIRSYVAPAMENVALWHERDISHSSVERCITPDACILTDFALDRLAYVLENLQVDEGRISKNLESSNGLVFSQQVLLDLVDSGLTRELAYSIAQAAAMRAIATGESFFHCLSEDEIILEKIGLTKLQSIFSYDRFLVSVSPIYERVLGSACK